LHDFKGFIIFTSSLMKQLIFCLGLVVSSNVVFAQFDIEPHSYNFGGVPLANQFYATFIVKNNGNQKGYLLKLDADNTIQYKKPMEAIEPGASDTLKVWFSPESDGPFNKEIKIYMSDNPTPVSLYLKGNLLKLDKDPTVNCYSFSSQAAGINIILADVKMKVEDAVTGQAISGASITQYFNSKPGFTMKANTDGIVSFSVKPNMYRYWVEATGYETIFVDQYVNRQTGLIVFKLQPTDTRGKAIQSTVQVNKTKDIAKVDNTTGLSTTEYSPNNIVFLIDVSASMRRKDKLPLLKESMHTLIDQLRPIDKISIITYADDARIIYPSHAVNDKEGLKRKVDSLIANGVTSANRGVNVAHKVLCDNYIDGGNNQVVLATDGAFTLQEKEIQLFEKGTVGKNKPVNFTILGFGTDKKGLSQLKKLSSRFDGHYIFIEDADVAQSALLKEIKQNSRRKR
jgi:Mg-chelatase subunit ChlD